MKNDLMLIPVCPNCNKQMHLRKNNGTDAQFCGTWYDCGENGCHCSTLIPSKQLLRFLQQQKH